MYGVCVTEFSSAMFKLKRKMIDGKLYLIETISTVQKMCEISIDFVPWPRNTQSMHCCSLFIDYENNFQNAFEPFVNDKMRDEFINDWLVWLVWFHLLLIRIF